MRQRVLPMTGPMLRVLAEIEAAKNDTSDFRASEGLRNNIYESIFLENLVE